MPFCSTVIDVLRANMLRRYLMKSFARRNRDCSTIKPGLLLFSPGERNYDEDLRKMKERIEELERELQREKEREKIEASLRRRRTEKKSSSTTETFEDPPPPYDEIPNEREPASDRNVSTETECQLCRKKPADFVLSCDHYSLCASCCGALRSCPECRGPILLDVASRCPSENRLVSRRESQNVRLEDESSCTAEF